MKKLTLPLVVAVLLLVAGCDIFTKNHGDYRAIPKQGWNKELSLTFNPQSPDSIAHYDIVVAVRHTDAYKYSNLSLVVDLIDSAQHVDRRKVNFILADKYGNWRGSGFGALYQSSVVVAQDVDPQKVRKITIWQAMNNIDVVHDVTDVGIILQKE